MEQEGPGFWVQRDSFVMPEIPESLGSDPLLLSLLYMSLFIEVSGENTINLDSAVEALENMSCYLKRLPQERLAAIQQQLDIIASYGEKNLWAPESTEFVRRFLTDAGVIE
jgi:hypothetical protein